MTSTSPAFLPAGEGWTAVLKDSAWVSAWDGSRAQWAIWVWTRRF